MIIGLTGAREDVGGTTRSIRDDVDLGSHPAVLGKTTHRIVSRSSNSDLVQGQPYRPIASSDGTASRAARTPPEHRAYELNVFSLFRLTQLAASHMAAAGEGAVLNISSMAGENRNRRMASYASSKAAENGGEKVGHGSGGVTLLRAA